MTHVLAKLAVRQCERGLNDEHSASEVTVFSIPFDAPSFIGRRAVVHTDSGVLRGLVRAFSPEGLDMVVELADGRTRLRHFGRDQVRVLALA